MSKHPTKRLTAPDGETADIDAELVPLIEALWAAGLETIGCCQDLGESISDASARKSAYWMGYVLLELPVDDACALLEGVKDTPQFAERMHWAADGAWQSSLPVIASGFSDSAEVMPWVQVHFPKDQLGDLLDVLAAGVLQAVRA